MNTDTPGSGGTSFRSDDDFVRVLASGPETGGVFSLLEWTAAVSNSRGRNRDYGVHRHNGIEETFYILEGSLEFILGDQILALREGDFIRVPAGTKHGYENVSGSPVKMLVSFLPGGFEQLFLKHMNDNEGFVHEATTNYDSEFGFPSP